MSRVLRFFRRLLKCPPMLRYSAYHVNCLAADLDCEKCWRDYDERKEASHD